MLLRFRSSGMRSCCHLTLTHLGRPESSEVVLLWCPDHIKHKAATESSALSDPNRMQCLVTFRHIKNLFVYHATVLQLCLDLITKLLHHRTLTTDCFRMYWWYGPHMYDNYHSQYMALCWLPLNSVPNVDWAKSDTKNTTSHLTSTASTHCLYSIFKVLKFKPSLEGEQTHATSYTLLYNIKITIMHTMYWTASWRKYSRIPSIRNAWEWADVTWSNNTNTDLSSYRYLTFRGPFIADIFL